METAANKRWREDLLELAEAELAKISPDRWKRSAEEDREVGRVAKEAIDETQKRIHSTRGRSNKK